MIPNAHNIQIARYLGVSEEDLAQVLTNKTSYVRKELYSVMMNVEQSQAQRTQLMRDTYAMLFAFVVETANHRIAPGPEDQLPHTQIVLLDQPGFQSKGPVGTSSAMFGATPLVSTPHGLNGFDEFCINFADELLHSYVVRATFEDSVGYNSLVTGDGVALPAITTMDNSGAVELLRGAQLSERAHKKSGGMLGVFGKACTTHKSGKSSEKKDEDLLQDLVARFGVHASFVTSPSVNSFEGNHSFGVNHYGGPCNYDVAGFVEKDADLLDSAFVSLMRSSTDPFVAKLFAGPSLAAERHSKDENIIVQAQVSSRPLRSPTPIPLADGTIPEEHPRLDPAKIYPVTTQLNYAISEIVASLDRAHLWTVSAIRPNDSGSANSFDRRRVKVQVRSLLLPDIVARRSTSDYTVEYEQAAFCDRYVPTMGGSEEERVRQCAHANGWKEGADYALGHRLIFLTYGAWKMVEDGLRATEKAAQGGALDDEASAYAGDGQSEYSQRDPFNNPVSQESTDNLMARSMEQPTGYGEGGLHTPGLTANPFRNDQDSGWDSDREYDKKEMPGDNGVPGLTGEKAGMVVNNAPNAVEEVPTSRTRRWWLYLVWATTFWIPTFCLTYVGRMKRPDIRLAWREKVTICWLIFLFNAMVIFYIVGLSRLLCPNQDKAWNISELAGFTDDNAFYVAVAGKVYDVSNYIQGQHSDISGENSNTDDVLEVVAGQDMTNYFPVPLSLGCPDLVTDTSLQLSYANWTAQETTAVHTSGANAPDSSSKLAETDWYTARFQPTIKDFMIGALVYDDAALQSGAADATSKKYWGFIDNKVYDLTDYIYTINYQTNNDAYQFLDETISDLFQQRSGQDMTDAFAKTMAKLDSSTQQKNMACLNNVFYRGESDFRKTARCQVAPIIILVFSIILTASIFVKCKSLTVTFYALEADVRV